MTEYCRLSLHLVQRGWDWATVVTDNFSGPGGAMGPLCVTVSGQ